MAGLTAYKPTCFAATAGKKTIAIMPLHESGYDKWLKGMDSATRTRSGQGHFAAKPGQIMPLYDKSGAIGTLVCGVTAPLSVYDFSNVSEWAMRNLPDTIVKNTVFTINAKGMDSDALTRACMGWGYACIRFDDYKSRKSGPVPRLLWPKNADRAGVTAHLESAAMVRHLVNIPANDMGPAELERAARRIATHHDMTVAVTLDKALLTKNLPMIHAVGKGSPRRPRLIDLRWGNPKHPKLTLVGKGVCFDTGGLDIKPSASMLMMKKDMGGAAHVLGLAHLIASLKLPVRLRVLIPAVENSVSGESFRPWDILQSRKGLSVEVGNTDAEGRLVLADALTLASEEKPDLLIDFATLTGAARVALGAELPALFSNRDDLALRLRNIAMAAEDPLWPMPLWPGYKHELSSSSADLSSTGGKAGAITAALFLQHFIDIKLDWVHLDVYAWEDRGRPGRPRGGTDMGLRAVYTLLLQRYGAKKSAPAKRKSGSAKSKKKK